MIVLLLPRVFEAESKQRKINISVNRLNDKLDNEFIQKFQSVKDI